MKWTSMFIWLFVTVSCGFMPCSMADVAHVSINLRMFDVGKLPLLKINIVSNVTDTDRFQFIMHQASGDERLMVSRINDFMLLVQGIDEVTDKQAVLQVKEYRDNYWMDVATLPLFVDSVPVGSPPDHKKLALYKRPPATVPLHSATLSTAATPATSQPATLVASVSTVSMASRPATVTPPVVTAVASKPAIVVAAVDTAAVSKPTTIVERVDTVTDALPVDAVTAAASRAPVVTVPTGCMLEYDGEQTLWRLASRYAKEWQTNVYAAAIGIFETNPKAFAQGKLSGLRRGAILQCPSSEALAQYADKRVAEKKFDSLL
ncbi:hypothetical protein [Shewanella sp.]|uniref:hypothetical protein n=1 Tax=Shewanella sp. TaxID=50422 RepID=UPI003A980F76